MRDTAQNAALIASILAIAPLAFFVFTVIVMVLVVSRLRQIIEELQRLNRQMTAIRFPHLPWPQFQPDDVVMTEWHDGVAWRMRGDGRWEHHRGIRWVEVKGPPS